MEPQIIIARRIALELRDNMLVNLGIGIPTLVANFVPKDLHVYFQSENGLIGTGPVPEEGFAHPMLTDAAGRSVGALPGACTFDSAFSFGLIRGGHVDMTVLGGSAGGPARAARQLDDSRQDGSGHGRGDGPRDRSQVRRRRDAAHGPRRAEDRQETFAAAHVVAPIDLLVTELATIGFPKAKQR